jgi:arsenate reductase
MSAGRIYNVLFLCTANSARSVLAEAALGRIGAGRFRAFSAGSQPRGEVNPHALRCLEREGYDVSGFRSKSWDEFSGPGAPEIDFVVTLCDSAAGESCPVWPGRPITVHWGLPDPAAVEGPDSSREKAFQDAYQVILRRIRMFLELPAFNPHDPACRHRLAEIGRS